MLAELLPVVVVAGIAIAVVYLLFNSVSTVSSKKQAASKVLDDVVKPKKEAAKQVSKKEKAAAKAREAEIDALVAKELAAPARGLAAEKYQVETLDDAKAKAKAKKEAQKATTAKAASPLSAAESKVLSEEQKAKDRAQGFKVVETKEEKKEVSSPTTAAASVKGAGHSGTKKSTASSPAAQQREELEKKLGQFFKSSGRKGKRDDDYTPATSAADKKAQTRLSPTSGVSIKKDIQRVDGNAWEGDKEWV